MSLEDRHGYKLKPHGRRHPVRTALAASIWSRSGKVLIVLTNRSPGNDRPDLHGSILFTPIAIKKVSSSHPDRLHRVE